VLHLQGERGLVDLPAKVLRVSGVEVLHELLRDGRATFDDATVADVHGEGAREREDVDAAMVVEPTVLDRNGRVAHRLRHLVLGQDHAVLGGVQIGDQRAVARVDRRRLGERTFPLVVQSGKVARAGHEGEHHEQGEAPGLHHRRERTPGLRGSWEATRRCARADMPIV
jgi:hypothetical protein